MRVPQYAMRPFATLALVALAAGCGGGDSTAPDAPFDPAGTSADIEAIGATFESPAVAGFVAASGAIGATLGESPAAMAVRAVPTKALILGGEPGATHYAARLAEIYVRPEASVRPSLSTAAIEEQYLGVTFVYNPDTDTYEPSALPGAPSNGVRFLVYAVDPISGVPVEPLHEVGYADISVTETATSASVRVKLVSGGVTYLEYAIGATGNQTTESAVVTVTVTGFVSSGQDRVNFDLDTHLTFTSTSSTITLDYTLTVPTRGNFRIDFESTATSTSVTSTLEARGPHGTVVINGTQTGTSATYDVVVNGDPFATISLSAGGQPVITGEDGEPLTQEELEALQSLLQVFVGGLEFFVDVLNPMG
jgi:hypothetical protein